MLWQTRPEHISDFDQLRLLTHRTIAIGGCTTKFGVSMQLALSVANVFSTKFALAPCVQDRFTSEAVIDTGTAGNRKVLQTKFATSVHSGESTRPHHRELSRPD